MTQILFTVPIKLLSFWFCAHNYTKFDEHLHFEQKTNSFCNLQINFKYNQNVEGSLFISSKQKWFHLIYVVRENLSKHC